MMNAYVDVYYKEHDAEPDYQITYYYYWHPKNSMYFFKIPCNTFIIDSNAELNLDDFPNKCLSYV